MRTKSEIDGALRALASGPLTGDARIVLLEEMSRLVEIEQAHAKASQPDPPCGRCDGMGMDGHSPAYRALEYADCTPDCGRCRPLDRTLAIVSSATISAQIERTRAHLDPRDVMAIVRALGGVTP